MVPKGIVGHTTASSTEYGDPDVDKARKILKDAGITQPVPLTFWFTTDRYGSGTAAEFTELKRQLDASGLFKITLQSKPWKDFQEGYKKGEYPVFGRGWFPDFPDPDNFIAPFVGKKNVLSTPYENSEITDQLLPAVPARERPRCGHRAVRAGAGDPRRRRPAAAAVAGQAVRRLQRGDRRRRARPRPADGHADVGAVPEGQLVAAIVSGRR